MKICEEGSVYIIRVRARTRDDLPEFDLPTIATFSPDLISTLIPFKTKDDVASVASSGRLEETTELPDWAEVR